VGINTRMSITGAVNIYIYIKVKFTLD
jgi:hypothetical protein